MAISLNFDGVSIRLPGGDPVYMSPSMQKKIRQYKTIAGTYSCSHPRVVKSFFMKDESRPMYHCDVCMTEVVPVEDDATEASEAEIVSAQKS